MALMVGVSFVSCDDDDEGDVGAPKELLGTWLWYGEEITFNANGSGVLVEDGESYPFSFTYDAASKTLTVSADGEVMRWTIVSISNSKMVAVDEDGYEDVFLRPHNVRHQANQPEVMAKKGAMFLSRRLSMIHQLRLICLMSDVMRT